jgi:glycerol-3-phosphate acyltransferase PlsY
MRLIFNILAIVGSAMFAGVMLAIGVTLGGYWKSLPASDFLDWFSQNNRFIMQVIPLVVAPAVLGLAGCLWLGWSEGRARALWIGALLCVVAVLFLTMAWFVPQNAQFAAKSVRLDQVPDRLNTWLMIHYVRIALATVGSVLGILAISR